MVIAPHSGSESGGEDQLGELEDMRIDRRVGGDRIGGVGPPQSRLTSFRTSEEAGDSVHGGRTFSNTLLGVNAFNGNESMGASMSLGNSLLGARATSTFRLPFNRKQLRGLGMSDSVVSVATVTETEKDPLVTSGGWQMFDPLLERNRLVGTGKEKEKRGVDKTGRTQHQHMFLANIQSTDHYRGDGDADGEEEEEERGGTQQPTPSPIAPLAPLACVSAAAGDVTTPSLSVTSTAITSPTSPPSLKAPLPSLKKDTSPQAIVHADSMPVHRSPFTGLKGLFKGSSNGRINPGDAGAAPVPVEEGKKTFMGGMLNRLSWGGKKTKPATVPPTPVTGPSATYSDESGSEGEEVQAPATKLFHRALPQVRSPPHFTAPPMSKMVSDPGVRHDESPRMPGAVKTPGSGEGTLSPPKGRGLTSPVILRSSSTHKPWGPVALPFHDLAELAEGEEEEEAARSRGGGGRLRPRASSDEEALRPYVISLPPAHVHTHTHTPPQGHTPPSVGSSSKKLSPLVLSPLKSPHLLH